MLQSGCQDPPFSNEMLIKFSHKNIDPTLYKQFFRDPFQAASDKFEKHIRNHPALSLFQAIQIFDPRFIRTNKDYHNLYAHSIIREFQLPTNDLIKEWGIYCNLEENLEESLNLDNYWKAKEKIFPNLCHIAFIYIWIPISGVDVERSFSMYKTILTDRRQALSEESVRMLNFLYFNKIY
jgi:hAT family C-terminal dimerisation region